MQASRPRRVRVEHCMGTVFSLDLRSPAVSDAAVEDVVRRLHWVDATFSTYRPESTISRLARGEITEDECAPEVGQVLARGRRLSVVTDHYFSLYADGSLDPSGLVKGWAIEAASDLLVAAGSTSHCLNGGGDVQCVGDADPGVPWRVGITDPHHPGQLRAVVAGSGIAVATSGTAERGTHIRNPRSRDDPVGLVSITLIGRHLGDVDAYATAAFAMGAAAREWIESLDEVEAFAVTDDASTWCSSGLAADTTGTLTVRTNRRPGRVGWAAARGLTTSPTNRSERA